MLTCVFVCILKATSKRRTLTDDRSLSFNSFTVNDSKLQEDADERTEENRVRRRR